MENVSKWLKEDVHVQYSLCIKLLLTSDSDFKGLYGTLYFVGSNPTILHLKKIKKIEKILI